jgi:hypothetical protein
MIVLLATGCSIGVALIFTGADCLNYKAILDPAS